MRRLSRQGACCLFLSVLLVAGCAKNERQKRTSAADGFDMRAELGRIAAAADPMDNPWDNERRLAVLSAREVPEDPSARLQLQGLVAQEFLLSGRPELATQAFRRMIESVEATPSIGPDDYATTLRQLLGLAYLRLGEQENCIDRHTAAACILPFDADAVHTKTRGAEEAMRVFSSLEETGGATPVTRYLLNIAAMAVGRHPDGVPPLYRIPTTDFVDGEQGPLPPFKDVAPTIGLHAVGLSGGGVTEDFDGDGDLDVLVSSWGLLDQIRYFRNDGDAGFTEQTATAGLEGLTGGLNLKHADYDNDGDFDVFVLRGAWLGRHGRHPNSLLENNGRGVFTDVTARAGVLSYHPTQTAEWNDFDGDGWLDLFVGNESTPDSRNPSELFHNNGDGTFTDIAPSAGVDVVGFVKGVTSGDIDNDGDPDLYLSMLSEPNRLFENTGGSFRDITMLAGVGDPSASFPTWFFDYDQDGWLDLLVLSYAGRVDVIVAALVETGARPETMHLFRNVFHRYNPESTPKDAEAARTDQGGVFDNVGNEPYFVDVTAEVGLHVVAKAMGSNFGDLDNDGFPDFYVGTGDPDMRTLVPNRMFHNLEGRSFADVTLAGRFGHLQKGHAVSFADLDEDGDQDVHVVMGGAFSGDVYPNAVFLNPEIPSASGVANGSVQIKLVGQESNRAGVGARVRLVVTEGGGARSIHGVVTTGGSFGANPHRLSLGTGRATQIDTLEVTWPWNRGTQVFANLPVGQRYIVTEGADEIKSEPLPHYRFPTGS